MIVVGESGISDLDLMLVLLGTGSTRGRLAMGLTLGGAAAAVKKGPGNPWKLKNGFRPLELEPG